MHAVERFIDIADSDELRGHSRAAVAEPAIVPWSLGDPSTARDQTVAADLIPVRLLPGLTRRATTRGTRLLAARGRLRPGVGDAPRADVLWLCAPDVAADPVEAASRLSMMIHLRPGTGGVAVARCCCSLLLAHPSFGGCGQRYARSGIGPPGQSAIESASPSDGLAPTTRCHLRQCPPKPRVPEPHLGILS